jgi:hypothetical protein
MPDPEMPPRLSQDTKEVLTRVLGLDAERIDELRKLNVI